MFEWSRKYNIGVERVDEEHHHLFDLLNEIGADVTSGDKSTRELEAALDHLMEYAHGHFSHEEELMLSHKVDARHVRRQQMEHKSFIHDVEKLRRRSVDENIQERYERLIQFVSAWLVFHTLRTDQQLGVQLRGIEEGLSPEEAYKVSLEKDLSALLYRPIVEALIHLWADAANRAAHLEKVVDTLGKK